MVGKNEQKLNHLDGSILHETCNLLVGEIEKLKHEYVMYKLKNAVCRLALEKKRRELSI
jgi:hypothetical protein